MVRHRIGAALSLAILGYVAVMAYMAIEQRTFLYVTAPAWQEPKEFGLPQAVPAERVMQDGAKLRGWWIEPTRANAPIYLYFHGNSDGLNKRAGRFGLMTQDGAGLLAMSYRGYGGSGGAPSENALLSDAKEILNTLTHIYPASRIIVFGESLGSGVALNVTRQVHVAGVILDSPYLSVLHRAAATYPWLPTSFLLVDTFRSDQWIGSVDAPILILHGTADDFVPPTDSEALAALGRQGNVTRKLYDGQPHVVPLNQGPMPDIEAFLARVLPH